MSARIASDEQWRFPKLDSVPYKFEQSIIYFEDEYFKYHLGINPVSLFKAIAANLKAGEVKRGGSTLTAQVIRLSRKSKKRSVWEKGVEFILAFRLELSFSKDEILNLYASNAPFGGNVVGLQAASWRYYGRPANKLSWGETATLAVLPNAPALIYPGKNHDKLLVKRNRLLDKLYQNDIIDSITCELAKFEPLPLKPNPLPQLAPHLLSRTIAEGYRGKVIKSTLNKEYQVQCNRIVQKYHNALINNEIQNAAAIVLEVETGNVLAYVGNTQAKQEEAGNFVDMITALRSSGSTLKPFLYALMLKEGTILPHSLVADIPTQISGYSPKNFNKSFDGAVPASNALARSLNIPAVRMLRKYGLEKFHQQLPDFGLTTINKSPDHYGLTLILGGAEISLWELSSAYASMARMLTRYSEGNSEYFSKNYHKANFYYNNSTTDKGSVREGDIFGAGPVYLTFEALSEMNRPIEGEEWRRFYSSKKIAWKTGTSFGHRDALAVGVTPKYVVAVWVGNADGEGRPGLTGASTAAPIMFEIYKMLPQTGWFDKPYDDLVELETCKQSGYQSTKHCKEPLKIWAPENGYRSAPCPYHKTVFLDKIERYRVTSECYPISDMVEKEWFILPPIIEWYYKSKDPFYKVLPPFHPDCQTIESGLDLIYPEQNAQIFIPRGFGSQKQMVVFDAVHRDSDAILYWHLDDEYLGETTTIHKMELLAPIGKHKVTIVTNKGETLIRTFQIIAK